jgi:hypothetical protein
MKTIISMSATKTDTQKIAELKRKKAEIVAKCKVQLAKLDIQLKALGHKPDMKLTYGKPAPKTNAPRVPGRIPMPKIKPTGK